MRVTSRVTALLVGSQLALALGAAPIGAQSTLENILRQMSSENSRGYLQPLADLMGADASSGWYHTAAIQRGPVTFGLEFVGAGSTVKDEHRRYVARAPEGFPDETFATATVFGGTGTEIQGPGGTGFRGSDGLLTADYLPSVVPQLRVGVAGSEAIVRYFSSSLVSVLPEADFPELNLFGFGVRHNVSQYFDGIPVDVAAGVFYSRSSVGSDASTGVDATYSGVAIGAQVSKTFSVITVFGGLASDGGKMTLGYESTEPSEAGRVEVDIDVERKLKFTTGAAMKLGLLRLFGDVSFGPATTFAGGLRVGM